MAPRLSPTLSTTLRRSFASKPSQVVLLPPALQQTAATVQLLNDVRATLVAVDELAHRESAWPGRVEEAGRKLERTMGEEEAGKLKGVGEEMEIAGELFCLFTRDLKAGQALDQPTGYLQRSQGPR